ncbi:MAG: carbohydrate ABC transporter permease [Eubacteriales bacterium]|nr:carbohydrate ABC transporter permease [Eubacteriales bacterium]
MMAGSKKQKKITSFLFYILYLFVAVIFLAPLVFLFVSAMKEETQLVSDMSTLKAFLPYGSLTLDNYVQVFEKLDFLHYFRNSALTAVFQVAVGMFINGMMGYALGLLTFRGRKALVSLMIALTIIPTEAVIINRFMVAFQLGMINTFWSLVIPNLATPMYVYLFYQHFRGMPKDLLEAAVIDGESYTGIFFRIMTPLSKPIYATVAIMSFIRAWGDLLWPTLVTRDNTWRTLPQALRGLSDSVYTFWGQIFAFSAMITLPILVIFLVFQRQFVQSVAMTGIKG